MPRRGQGVGVGVSVLAAAAVAALLVSATGPLVPFVLVVVLGWMWVAYMRPMVALAVGLLAIPADTFFMSGPVGISPAQGLILTAALGCGARWFTRRPLAFVPSAAAAGLLLLVVATGTGLIFAPQTLYPLKQLINWGAFFVIFQTVVDDGSPKTVRSVLMAFAICGGITGLLAVVAPSAGGTLYAPETGARAAGSFGSPNGLGIFLALSIPIQLAIALRGPLAWRPIAAGCFAFAAFGLTLTLSRGAFLGLAAGTLAMTAWPPFRRAAAIGIVCLIALTAIGSNPVTSAIDANKIVSRITGTKQNAATDPRGKVYDVAPQMIADHGVFGMGALEYGTYSPRYGIPITGGVTTHAHDITLTIWIELGLMGLAGLFTFAYGIVRALRRAVCTQTGFDHALSFALVGCFVALATEGILDYPLGNANIAAVVFVLGACAVNLGRRQGEPIT